METIKKLIIVTALTAALGPVAGAYAMDNEEERKDVVAQVEQLTDEQKAGLNQMLFWAAQEGDVCWVESVLNNGADINVLDEKSFSALSYAAYGGFVDMVELLLTHGANVDGGAGAEATPLQCAIMGQHKNIVEILFKHNVKVNSEGGLELSPLAPAIAVADIETIEMLLKRNVDVDAVAQEDCSEKFIIHKGDTVLHLAVRKGCADIVKILVAHKVTVNVVNGLGHSPLHEAVKRERVEIVTTLIEAGADLYFCNKLGNTAFDLASPEMLSVIVDALVAKSKAEVPAGDAQKNDSDVYRLFVFAIDKDRIDIIERLLANDVKVNMVDCYGRTPLYFAALSVRVEIARILLAKGAAVNVTIWINDDTTLHMAVRTGKTEMVEVLLQYGADINVKNRYGRTPLHYAAHRGEVAKMLIAAGADFNSVDEDGNTPFDIASPEAIRIMVEAVAEKTKKEEPVGIAQRAISDLPIMLFCAAENEQDRQMVPWLLRLDPKADENGGICSICATSFADRVLNDGVTLCSTTRACPHLVCDECAQMQREAQAAPDEDRERGIYLGRHADGSHRWMLPGRIDLSRCPECRAEPNGRLFMPRYDHFAQFCGLKEEFNELELARKLSIVLKRTSVLRRFIPEAGIVDLVDGYAGVAPAGAQS